MQRINAKHIEMCGEGAKDWGKVLAGVQRVKYGSKQAPQLQSYAEAWESIKSIREQYGM
jgi:hypothetical protein